MQLQSATGFSLAPAETSRERLHTAARELESQFAQMMIKTMRSTSMGDEMFGGDNTYRDMYDQKLSQELTKGRGLGLAPMITRQLQGAMPLPPPKATGFALPTSTMPSAGPMSLTQNLPLAMPLSAPVAYSGVNPATLTSGALSLAPTRSGISMAAAAPVAAPLAPAADAAHGNGQECDSKVPLDCSSPEAFVKSIWPHAKRTAAELGVSAKALVAQAALETGWGRRLVGGHGSSNLFGIKATGWNGAKVNSGTHEYVNGVRQNQRAEFRAYDSIHDSFADYAKLMRNGRYAGALAAGTDARGFAGALQKAGYATDPAYAAKISAIVGGPTLNRALAALPDGVERG